MSLRFDPIAEGRRQWTEHWGPETAAPMAAVTSIMRAQQIVLGRLNELLGPLGLTFARYEALMLLHYTRTGEMPLGKISDRLQVHRASVTNVIDKLVESGLVERIAHARDRRTTLARITPAGRDVAVRATQLLNAARMGMDVLSDEQMDAIAELLRPLRVDDWTEK